MTLRRPLSVLNLPLRQEQLHVLLTVLGDYIEEADELGKVESGLLSEHHVDTARALHRKLCMMDRAIALGVQDDPDS